jgi:hypothetical protein
MQCYQGREHRKEITTMASEQLKKVLEKEE